MATWKLARLLACSAALMWAGSAAAAVVTGGGSFNGRYTSLGEVGGPQDLILFGINVTPNAKNGTTAIYAQTDLLSGTIVTGPMRYPDFSLAPDLFDQLVPYSPGLAGAWQFTLTNNGDQTVLHSPALGAAPALPFVQSIALQGGGSTPTVHWTVPSSPDVNRQEVWVWENRPNGTGDLVHTSGNLQLSDTSYTVPATLNSGGSLEVGKSYSFSFVLFHDRDEGGTIQYAVSRSFTYIPYTVLPAVPDLIYLPVVQQTGGQPVFSFQPIDVVPGEEILIDPLIAIGYEYEVRIGDPLFQSVGLPVGIGDGVYQVEYLDGGTLVVTELPGGETLRFPDGGVGRFTVSGIEVGAQLDANDSTAFVTALTFAGPGVFAGTMTPITAVPEPTTLALTAIGLLLAGGLARRTTRAT